jgi:cell fate regulator YaaT (PSP1 superfamily)
MCCLRYEHEFYKEAKERLPSVGATVPTKRGPGKVIDVNLVSGMLTVETEGSVHVNVRASDLDLSGCCRRHGMGCPMQGPSCKLLTNDETRPPTVDSQP